MTISDTLVYWLFHADPDRILALQPDLAGVGGGYLFLAPVLKEREYRLDGVFLPPEDQPQQPAVILEAQMAADPGFLRRLFAESGRWLQQNPSLDHWRALALLVELEERVSASSSAIRQQVAGTAEAGAPADVIAAIVITRFNGRSLKELCAMGGITLDDLRQSTAYREIFGQGHEEGLQEGRQEGRQEGELDLTLRQLRRRCGGVSAEQEARIRALPLARLERLAEALLDFQTPSDLARWLAAEG